MKKKFLVYLLAILALLTGCSVADSEESSLKANTGEVSAVDSNTGSTEVEEDPTEAIGPDSIINGYGENNDPEAAELMDKAFSQDEYHLAIYLEGDTAVTYEINATSEPSNADSVKHYDIYNIDGFITDIASEKYSREEIEGPFSPLDQGTRLFVKERGMILSLLSAGQVDGTSKSMTAIPIGGLTPYDIFDSISSDCFSDLTIDGDTVKGVTDISLFHVYDLVGALDGVPDGEVEIEAVFDNGTLKTLNAGGFYYIEMLEGPASRVTIDDNTIITFLAADDTIMQISGESGYDFSGKKPEDYIRWAQYNAGDTDTNGVHFRLVYDHKKDKNSITMDDIYIDPDVRYGDFKFFGDVNETVRRFYEYKKSVSDTTETKKLGNEWAYKIESDGLPRWYSYTKELLCG